MKASGSSAVMNARASVPDALDDFPTPCWATRALSAIVLPTLGLRLEGQTVWEPAANRLTMALPLTEYAHRHPQSKMSSRQGRVWTSDVFNYGAELDEVGSFIGEAGLLDDMAKGPPGGADWIITNPPFNLAMEFTLAALQRARVGVAMLCRLNWLEGLERHASLFEPHPPTAVCPFVERVPMTEGGMYSVDVDCFNDRGELVETKRERHRAYRGGYDPEASTATAYAWFVWVVGRARESTRWAFPHAGEVIVPPLLLHIPPCRERLTMPDDARCFGKIKEAPHA